jgi:hypothetical protein
MDQLTVQCTNPDCARWLRAAPAALGHRIRCPACKKGHVPCPACDGDGTKAGMRPEKRLGAEREAAQRMSAAGG